MVHLKSLDLVHMKSLDLDADEDGKVQIMQYEIHIALGASNNLLHSRNVLQSQETASQVPLPNRGTLSRKVQSQRLICFSQARSQPLGLQ